MGLCTPRNYYLQGGREVRSSKFARTVELSFSRNNTTEDGPNLGNWPLAPSLFEIRNALSLYCCVLFALSARGYSDSPEPDQSASRRKNQKIRQSYRVCLLSSGNGVFPLAGWCQVHCREKTGCTAASSLGGGGSMASCFVPPAPHKWRSMCQRAEFVGFDSVVEERSGRRRVSLLLGTVCTPTTSMPLLSGVARLDTHGWKPRRKTLTEFFRSAILRALSSPAPRRLSSLCRAIASYGKSAPAS